MSHIHKRDTDAITHSYWELHPSYSYRNVQHICRAASGTSAKYSCPGVKLSENVQEPLW